MRRVERDQNQGRPALPALDAFVRLRAHAFAAHRPLADVARDVVAGRLLFTEDMD